MLAFHSFHLVFIFNAICLGRSDPWSLNWPVQLTSPLYRHRFKNRHVAIWVSGMGVRDWCESTGRQIFPSSWEKENVTLKLPAAILFSFGTMIEWFGGGRTRAEGAEPDWGETGLATGPWPETQPYSTLFFSLKVKFHESVYDLTVLFCNLSLPQIFCFFQLKAYYMVW